jgi:hypothetical protein
LGTPVGVLETFFYRHPNMAMIVGNDTRTEKADTLLPFVDAERQRRQVAIFGAGPEDDKSIA